MEIYINRYLIGMIMKFLIILFMLSFSSVAEEYQYKILRVIDGDTIVIEAPYLPKPLKPEIGLRIYGLDTPEKGFRSHCTIENTRAEEATTFTNNAVKQARSIKVVILHWDKYARLLGDVILDGVSLHQMLLNNGLARPYFGEKKSSWCN